MADDADPTDRELTGPAAPDSALSTSGEPPLARDEHPHAHRLSLIAVSLILVLLGGLAGWQGSQVREVRKAQQDRAEFLRVARQGALNLTTIGSATAEGDIQRILDISTGVFREDFQQRSQPFIDAVKQAHSTTSGSITDAGLQSVAGDGAQALVAVAVTTSNAAAAEQETRSWRMRISVQRTDSGVKVADVEFVP